jgi:hypothetical protein
MELAIPLIALGGMYVISNQKKNMNTNTNNDQNKEDFTNMGIRTNLGVKTDNYLPNVNIQPQNYPVTNNKELVDNIQEYPNPNAATDKYFNQNLYEEKERANQKMGNNIQEVYSLTGDYLSSTEFKHNNMVPFNGGKPQGQMYNNNNAETILDSYVGNGSQFVKKVEQAPLFKPQDNVQLVHGAPNMSDFYQSRVNPATRNNMVKPFETINVGPGLGKGYSTEGSGGFNSGMEKRDAWMPKTVDELRIATNPKEEYSMADHQGPANSIVKNIGVLGKVEKNTPDTFYINSQDRWLTTTGAEKANRLVADEIFKTSHRNETTTYQTGTPNATLKTASYVPINHEESKRIQLSGPSVGPSNASGAGPHQDGETFLKSHTNYTNSRSLNPQPQTFGSGFSRAIGAAMAPIMDVLKPAKKEEYVCNMRIYGNMGGEVPGNYIQNEGDVPNTTVKETTLYQPHGYFGNQQNGAYEVADQQAIANQRDTTNYSQFTPMGGSGSKHGSRQYDSVYRQTNNEAKEKSIAGRTNQGNAKMFNSQINVTMSKLDSDRDNNRLWAPSAVIQSGPSVQTQGKTNTPQYCAEIQDNRLEPNLLQAFKENPYTHSLSSAV